MCVCAPAYVDTLVHVAVHVMGNVWKSEDSP